MSIIKLEIDSTDSIVCGAFAVAFQTLAGGVMQEKEPKPTLTSGSIKEELEKEIDDNTSISIEDITQAEINAGFLESKPRPGLPHDSRIHSSGKVVNGDGTWKYARKPKDKTPDEWKEYIAQVESELEQLMAIPVPEPEEMEKIVDPRIELQKELSNKFGEIPFSFTVDVEDRTVSVVAANNDIGNWGIGTDATTISKEAFDFFNELTTKKATPTLNAGPKPPVDKEELQEEPKPKPPVAPPVEAPTSVTFAEIMKVAVKCGVANANAIVAEMGVPEPYMPNLKKREDLFSAAYAALVEAIGA